jgi:glucosyl-dolichyl phosphate glucuronosyltransferase
MNMNFPKDIPSISVVICTYNRADRLRLALDALCTQTLSPQSFEILVVDNASTDDTAALCTFYKEKLPQLHYLFEPVQGLSRARNTAWEEAKSPYIAYLDDDAIPCDDWIESILLTFETIQGPLV